MSNTTAKVPRWPGDPLDPTKRYRAVLDGLIYVLTPAKGRSGYWWAAVKRGNRRLKWSLQPLREDALLRLFVTGFFPAGLQLVQVKARNTTR